MALALIVLAAGSVLAGYTGGALERFLEPTLGVQVTGAEAVDVEALHTTELTLMAVSSLVAVAGIGLAAFLFLKSRATADALAARYAGPRRLLQNKYYVDEIYSALVVGPIRRVSESALWRGVDVRVIDGVVNGAATAVGAAGAGLRRMQTGSVRAYAASVFFGAVLVLGYYLWA
jgi:NADH-quinone oxidoreductase subunit L